MSSASRLLCCVWTAFFFFACSSASRPAGDDYAQSIQAGKSLVSTYGALATPDLSAYLRTLLSRLVTPNPAQPDELKRRYEVTILDTGAPMAFSAGSGFIIISRGLVLSLKSEGELAFVLAHEMAHQELHHTQTPHSTGKSNEEEMEIAADRFALEAIMRAGYHPQDALSAIQRAANSRSDLTDDPVATSVVTIRVSELRRAVREDRLQSSNLPFPSRRFARFQEMLR